MDKFKIYYYGIIIYTIALAILYLWGYWGMFNFDVLPYINLWDILKFATYSLFLTSITFIIAALADAAMIKPYIDSPHFSDKLSKLPKCAKKSIIPLCGITVGLSVLMGWWCPVGIISGWFVAPQVNRTPFLSEMKNTDLKFVIIYLIWIAPFFIYMNGITSAEKILKNRAYLYTNVEINKNNETLKFLGQLNEHYFFLSLDNSTITIKNKIDTLQLKKSTFKT
jgi:hypothetical protein